MMIPSWTLKQLLLRRLLCLMRLPQYTSGSPGCCNLPICPINSHVGRRALFPTTIIYATNRFLKLPRSQISSIFPVTQEIRMTNRCKCLYWLHLVGCQAWSLLKDVI